MQRAIIHLDLDTFFVSCERLLDRSLWGKPVLIGGTSDRGVVASCSYEARSYGIHSAMPMKLARQLCPHAIVIRGNSATYTKFSEIVTEIIRDQSPVYEKASVDEFYIDASGMDKFFGTYRWAQELREKIRKETQLPLSFALSINKTVSKVGTGLAKPDNHLRVESGSEKDFLAPLSVKKIPMVGDQTYQMLRSMGVEKIGTIQQMSPELMERVMGKNGLMIWKKANGIDPSPVVPYQERKSISSSLTFERDTIDVRRLREILSAMTEKLAYHLRKSNRLTGCLTVTVRYSDFDTHSRQDRIPYTSCDHILIPRVLSLFDLLYQRRVLCRLVGVKFSHLVGGGHQINMFEESEELIRLYQSMDSLRNRYGSRVVMRGSAAGGSDEIRDIQ